MKRKKPGFTLVEMIIALALTVTILGIASSMFITGNKVFSESDVKSTLQIEGQAIQEKISDIGMQAIEIKSVNVNNVTNEINMVISSYGKDGNLKDFKIETIDTKKNYKDTSKIYELRINDALISSNIKSFTIDNSIITANINNTLKTINSIEFNISLRKEKAYGDTDYMIKFKTAFRNK